MAETKLKKNLAVQVIKDHNISKIQIYYSGGGDDGCIDSVQFLQKNFNPNKEDYKETDIIMDKEIEIEWDELLYDLLNEHIEWDWVNNAGGSGTMYIDCTKDPWVISIDHDQNITENYQYSDIEFKIETKRGW
jgi:hypothetical protein